MTGAPAYEHNDRSVSRAQFYAIACDPRRSVAVEACAGAGKTWMLVSRIVRALLEGMAPGAPAPLQPHEILAITFTRKAAGEMRERLHEWLEQFARDTPGQLEKELVLRGMSPKSARDGAGALQNLYQTVLTAGRPVQIRTFHSWFAALLRSAPLAVLDELQLPINYELLEDDSEAVAAVWPRFYAAVVGDAGARADFDALVAAQGRSQAARALAAALARRGEFVLADAHGVVDRSVQTFAAQFPEMAGFDTPDTWLLGDPANRQPLADAARALGRAKQATAVAKGSELEQALAADNLTGVVEALLTQKHEPRKFKDDIAGIEAVRAAQALAQRMLAGQAQHEAWQHQQRMTRLARLLITQFAALKRERGWVDMPDVERAAFMLLADPVLSGWVQERLDARVRHLLIDEFQDTNPLQWQALHAWLSSYAGAGGTAPSVFIVGDPKQSIYRFRRAEPQVFRAARAFVAQGLGGDCLSCDHTWRNAPAVLDTVNAVMQRAQDENRFEGFRTHTTESGETGGVLRLPVIPRDARVSGSADASDDDVAAWRDSLSTQRTEPEDSLRTIETRQAARWLAAQLATETRAGLRPQDILVLSRKRESLTLMQDALRALHIPALQPEKTDLADAPEVQDVVALLDALVSPAHDLSLARALKSPLFGVGDDDLVQLALLQRRAREDATTPDGQPASTVSWFDLLQKEEHLTTSLSGLGVILTQYQGWLAQLPPHDALDAIYAHGDVLARFAAATPTALRNGVLANLRALLGASLAIDGARYLTPYGLVRALRRGGVKAPVQADAQAVRLLTVHGAKGLEAPLTLLLDTDAMAQRAETMGVLVKWPGEDAFPSRLVMLASETNPPPCAVELLMEERAERAREELNALYVAMTRAQTTLVVSAIAPHQANPLSWWQHLEALAAPVDVPEAALEAPAPDAAGDGPSDVFLMPKMPDVRFHRSFVATNSIAFPVSTDADADPDAASAGVGLAMHRLLEWTASGGPLPDDSVWPALVREFSLSLPQVQQAARMAATIHSGAGAWAWDANLIDWEANEVELTHQGQVLRLDRLVRRRDGGAWWVLDYKSAASPERQPGLVEQLRQYRAALQAIHPGQPVRSAFLTAAGDVVEVAP